MSAGGLAPLTGLRVVTVIVLATVFIWIASGWLEDAAQRLSVYYGVPPVVQGSVVVAIGSSFPEFASVMAAAFAGVFEMGIGAIVGSAIFNVLVIPAIAGLATDSPLESSRTIVYKEAQFYMIAVAALVVTFSLAVIYIPAAEGPPLTGTLTRPLVSIPLLLYGLYLFIQWQDVTEYEALPTEVSIDVTREWATLVAGLLVIVVAVEQLVGAVETLGTAVGLPAFLGGVTIVAAATSLPDTLVSVRSARAERAATSLGNVLGSNTFDLLVVIPVGVLVVGRVSVDFATAVPMLGVLTFATVLLFTTLRTDLTLTEREAYILLATYALFVAWVVAETVGVTGLLRSV